MDLLKLIVRNTLRHPLRSLMTSTGIALALLAFFMIRTFINAWYAGITQSAPDRLITRNAMSLIFFLPKSYKTRIETIPGVASVSGGVFFGGIYKDERYHMAQFAVDDNYMEVYKEYIFDPEEGKAYFADRKGALIGNDIAEKYGLKIGDVMHLKGTIFPGNWELVVRGIFKPRDGHKDSRFLYFHYDYLNEYNRTRGYTDLVDYVGYFAIRLNSGTSTSQTADAIDSLFKNSFAETITQTETAFVQGFISMSSALILAMNSVSLIVIPIILLVLSNTMLMATRERIREYTIMRAVGFPNSRIAFFVLGESLCVAVGGFAILLIFVIPVFQVAANFVLGELASFFPQFPFDPIILLEAFLIIICVGLLAGLISFWQIKRVSVSDGLRTM